MVDLDWTVCGGVELVRVVGFNDVEQVEGCVCVLYLFAEGVIGMSPIISVNSTRCGCCLAVHLLCLAFVWVRWRRGGSGRFAMYDHTVFSLGPWPLKHIGPISMSNAFKILPICFGKKWLK